MVERSNVVAVSRRLRHRSVAAVVRRRRRRRRRRRCDPNV